MSKKRTAARSKPEQSSSKRVARSATSQLPPVWLISGLLAITVAAFSAVWSFGFVRFDDPDYVSQNPHVTAGLTWAGVKWALTTNFIANWHPLTWLSHMLDVQLFGMNAGAHHVVNLIFHLANTILLFEFLRRATGALWRSAFAAALFAVHPLHVESVAWISERKDVLSTFFWMLALLAYLGYVRTHRRAFYVLVLVFFAFGLIAKPMVVTLPFVLLLLDVWPLGRVTSWHESGRTVRRLLGEKVPLFLLAAASSVVTVIVQKSGGAVGSLAVYPLPLRAENAIVNYSSYLAKTIWPWPLAAFYAYRETVSPWQLAGAAVLIVVLSIAAVKSWPKRPYVLVGWLWYLGTLVPVIGIVQAGLQSMADRYTYIPLIGPFIAFAWAVGEAAERFPAQRVVFASGCTVVVALLVGVTHSQTETWRDSMGLWQHAADVTVHNAYAEYNLGVVLVQAGRVDEGIAHFRNALRIDPNYSDVHIDLGNALNRKGAADEAIAEFATVVRLRPDYAEAHLAYGNLLRARGRVGDAAAEYRTAIRIAPGLASAHNELGNVLVGDGQNDEAMVEYTAAVRLAPEMAEAHNNLGAALARAGRTNDAIHEFLEALRLKPDAPMFHYNAALMLEGAGRAQEAVTHLQTVLRLEPENAAARRALDRLTTTRGPG